MKTMAMAVCLVVSVASSALAQVGTEPLAWEPEHRALAEGLSNALIGVQVAGSVIYDVKAWKKGDYAPAFRSGCSIVLAVGLSELLKRAVHEERPDGSDNRSWPSGHSASSMALSGWNFTFGVPVSVMTGFLRNNANKHHLVSSKKDIPWGWALGAGAQAACSALIR